METNGSLDFLTPDDVRSIRNVDRFLEFVIPTSDVGVSLLRASIVKKLRDLEVGAAFDIVQAYGVGRLMTTGAGRRLLMGSGAEKRSFDGLRLLGAAGATIAKDEQALGVNVRDTIE